MWVFYCHFSVIFLYSGNYAPEGIPLQIQTKAIDNNPNIVDLKKARNANEVVVVLSRINTACNILASKFNKNTTATVESGLEALRFCVDSLIELRCARSVAQEFNDVKRDRCFSMIEVGVENVRQLQRRLLYLIDRACSIRMDKRLDELANTVLSVLEKIGKITQLHVKIPGFQMIVLRTSSGAVDNNGYSSGPITVKLCKRGPNYTISIPDSPYVETDETPIADAVDIQRYLLSSISDFEYIGKPTVKDDKLLAQPFVREVNVLDDSLEVVLDQTVQPAEINSILSQILPYLRKAVNLSGTDVIHRVNLSGDRKTIQFALAKRILHDPRSLAKVSRLLSISRANQRKLTSILEK